MKRGWVVALDGRLRKATLEVGLALGELVNEQLAELHAVASVNDGVLSTTATVIANSYSEALDYFYEALSGVVGGIDVERAEVITEERQERDLSEPVPQDLVGITEIAELVGTSKQRVFQMTANRGFPQPVLELAAGRLWHRGAVQRYLDSRPRRGGIETTKTLDIPARKL